MDTNLRYPKHQQAQERLYHIQGYFNGLFTNFILLNIYLHLVIGFQLYPESCPDAVTKVTVWKRYNDFRKLHREIKALHKSFQIKDKLPNLPNTMFFKRLHCVVIVVQCVCC